MPPTVSPADLDRLAVALAALLAAWWRRRREREEATGQRATREEGPAYDHDALIQQLVR